MDGFINEMESEGANEAAQNKNEANLRLGNFSLNPNSPLPFEEGENII
jgi:hypothetical protein